MTDPITAVRAAVAALGWNPDHLQIAVLARGLDGDDLTYKVWIPATQDPDATRGIALGAAAALTQEAAK